ncbi:MAG: NADH-quinone oxidoreductase subunit L [Desulforhabdus sp.]|jgi:NADH-quinone oxidoreductase subunit L|nr:NADH-quinone oxidoreductase subunit L [Desulforhabdus sp.]
MAVLWSKDVTLLAAVAATLAPFASFVLIMVFTRSHPRLSAGLSLSAAGISLICALALLAGHWDMPEPIQYSGNWLASGDIHIPFGYLLDPVSLLMLAVVAVIGFLILVYSLGYMAGDPGFARYYALMSLFLWAMMCLALSPTMFQLYVFWELVGLSSYFLIGFWYEKFSASQAGKKAFIMTRAGDVAMFVGVILVLLNLGNLNILDMDNPSIAGRIPQNLLTLSALLIFGGIIGKSAQFPLLTWLPDAMQGPTPVSALLHSSTMVAAGVYLFERLFPFFSLSPHAMAAGLAIGTISMLLASTMAMVSRDIKEIWAYSTISQLGFMLMGLDAGSFFSGAFHLTTHAAFKALLFLCAGVFIHKFATNDIFELGEKGSRNLRVPMVCTVIAAGALAGLPPLSGFFSKELILAGLAGLANPLWLAAALLGVFLTAYYAFRPIFIVLFPHHSTSSQKASSASPDSGHEDAHDQAAYRLMAIPLLILAGMTLLLGFFQYPLQDFLKYQYAYLGIPADRHYGWLPYVASFLAFGGVGVAWVEFGRPGAARVGFVERIPILFRLFSERWYLDHLYRYLLERVVDKGLSHIFAQNDNKVIDGSIDGLGHGTVESGRIIAFLHTGMIQYRLLAIFVVMVLLSLYFFF